MEKGVVLKLDEEQKITNAIEGFEVLNEEDVE
jgi:hypothetical protein